MDELFLDLEKTYGIVPLGIEAIDGGWLNRLWRVRSDRGVWIVKLYSPARYSTAKLDALEPALAQQHRLHKAGFVCPEALSSAGKFVRRVNEQIAYTVHSFCTGEKLRAETITPVQMESLGDTCARMHVFLAEASPAGTPPDPMAEMNAHLEKCRLERGAPEAFHTAVRESLAAADVLDSKLFDRVQSQLSHEDFAPDNLLFSPQGVSAVIDFDRCHLFFPLHDVGRALLSFALSNNVLRINMVRAFQSGYARHRPLSAADIADALRVTWCTEVPWWVLPECFQSFHGKATRYRDEILWLGPQLHTLEAILSDLKS